MTDCYLCIHELAVFIDNFRVYQTYKSEKKNPITKAFEVIGYF